MLTALMLFCGCTEIPEAEEAVATTATEPEPQPYPVTAEGLVFNSSPSSVGSLSPAVTEIIFELGFGDRLVCRSSYCDYPEEALAIPEAGSGANPDFDRITDLHPELLITQSPIANKDLNRLHEAGITVMQLPVADSLDSLYNMYITLSEIFSGSIEGSDLAENAVSGLKAAMASAKGSCESVLFIMNITSEGISAATGDTFAGDYVSHFGRNSASSGRSFFITSEELIEWDPQVIFLAHPLTADDIDTEIAEELSAFENEYVYVIDGSLLERPTTRLESITRSIAETVREATGGTSFEGGFAVIPEETENVSTVDEDNDSENVN